MSAYCFTVRERRTVQLKWMELNDTITYLWIVNLSDVTCVACDYTLDIF